jgi:hypothetical protein
MEQSRRVRNNIEFLKYFVKATSIQLASLIRVSTDRELLAICEITLNFIKGNIKSPEDFSSRQDFLRTLGSKSVTLARKRDILNNSKTYRTVLQKFIKSVL